VIEIIINTTLLASSAPQRPTQEVILDLTEKICLTRIDCWEE